MKHVHPMTVRKAQDDNGDLQGILDSVFAFVLELVDRKGKSASG